MKDVIIVGQGLAAAVLTHRFYETGFSFQVIGNPELSRCSQVAAGIFNPVVFKRLTKSWLADELILHLNTFYSACEKRLNKKLLTQRPIIKPFVEAQEKKLWQKKSFAELRTFLDEEIYQTLPDELSHFIIPNGYSRVLQSGNLNVSEFLNATFDFFKDNYLAETFDYSELKISDEKIIYKNLEAKYIIFCEGYLVKHNPFFSWLPLKPAKGEVLTIQSSELKLKNQIFNKNGFVMDIGENQFKLGATYEWNELNEETTSAALNELKEKFGDMTSCNFSVLKQEAGVRPSSIDRRPIIGAHPKHKKLYVFNGLGTKGVMLAPFFANNLVNSFLQTETLRSEINVNRFYHLYFESAQEY
ncbi:MAG: FAD-dependent oxidoreductase [Bacteroidetes bacterium]|nr:FAD-dependent oxidoreductase [Bacteroidota bacterium]